MEYKILIIILIFLILICCFCFNLDTFSKIEGTDEYLAPSNPSEWTKKLPDISTRNIKSSWEHIIK